MSEKSILHFIVGDIHGCYDELLALEEKIIEYAKFREVDYKIVSVGDLIDRGPASNHVIQHFVDGFAKGTHLAVMGNHEALFLNALNIFNQDGFTTYSANFPAFYYDFNELYQKSKWSVGINKDEFQILYKAHWLAQGGVETLESYGQDVHEPHQWKIPEEHFNFLANLPIKLEINDVVVTHALANDLALEKAAINSNNEYDIEAKDAFHFLMWNRSLKEVTNREQKKLVSGHTPYDHIKKDKEKNTVQVDTNCFVSGCLSAYCPELDLNIQTSSKIKI